MQIKMNYIDTHVTGPGHSDERVHIGPIHIDEPACLMNDLANLLNVLFEQTQCVWVSQH